MNKREADKIFNSEVKPSVIEQYGKHDKIALITAWNDWTDMLCKDGEITQKQYDTWQCPVKDNRK